MQVPPEYVEKRNRASRAARRYASAVAIQDPEARSQALDRILREVFQFTTYVEGCFLGTYEALEEMRGNKKPQASGKKWQPDQDNILVSLRAGGHSMEAIASALGRTTLACSTRLSELVGVSRDVTVDRLIVGSLDEEPVAGRFVGTLKAKPKENA